MALNTLKIDTQNIILNQLLVNGVTNPNLIDIFINIDKNIFLPNHLKDLSTSDCLLYINKSRFIQENASLLYMLQIANIIPESKVLVIGADLGFSLAIISKLAKQVICIEEDDEILEQTRLNLQKIMFNNIEVIKGKFIEGYANENSLFDCIIINGAFLSLPTSLLKQIKQNGSIIGAQRSNNLSEIVKITNTSNPEYIAYKHANVPYLKGLDQNNKFEF